MAMKRCTPLVGVIAALWVVLACVVIKHQTLQFFSGGAGRLAGSSLCSQQPSSRPSVRRKCEGGDAEVPPQTTRRIFEGKEVFPLTVALLTVATFASMVSDPVGISWQQRTRNTLPFSRSLEQLSDQLNKWVPARAERVRAEQMQNVAAVSLVTPVAMAIATRKGGPVGRDEDSWDAGDKVLRELVIGCVYEGKDAGGNYWAFTATALNPDGTYVARLLGDMFEDEPLWPQVYVENCRRVANPMKLSVEARAIMG